jgi:protoporphyrinogen oxidase
MVTDDKVHRAGVRRAMTALTILGGGPAGLGLAFYAHRADVPFVLFERSKELGGMCRTLRHGEHLYDCGAHRFHDRDPEITRDLVELMGEELLTVDAPSRICDRGRFINFPPTPLNVLLSCRPGEAGRIGLELMRVRWRPRSCASFKDFAVSQFGETLSRRLLLNYSEKLWGLPADELSPDIATRRLQGMTLRSLLLELIVPGREATHIDGQFLYPRRGYGQIIDRLKHGLPAEALRTGYEVARLECRGGAITHIHFAAGRAVATPGRVVSTLPLTLLVKFLGDQMPDEVRRIATRLRFRQIRLIFLRLRRPRVSAYASVYIPDPALCVSRLYEPKNRSAAMAPADETSLVVEVPCFADDAIHRTASETLAERVIGELAQLKLLDRRDVIDWKHHLLANAYPVYTRSYAREVRVVRDALARIANLDVIGRAGLFFYSHLHDQLRFGKDYVEAFSRSERGSEDEPGATAYPIAAADGGS